MGGIGSGNHGGRQTTDSSLCIDIAWLMRTGRAENGKHLAGSLSWTRGEEMVGSIGYHSIMNHVGDERLELSFAQALSGAREQVHQTVQLCHTEPNFGGKRWWMTCPFRQIRVGKLYLPPGGNRFASRQAWRLSYQSQLDAERDRQFERLFRLQRKLGCSEGWEAGLTRPKGMWARTFERHLEHYWRLDDACSAEMAQIFARLSPALGER